MKTSVVNRSLKALALGLNKVMTADKKPLTNDKPQGLHFEKYSSWPNQDAGRLSFSASDLKLRQVDFRLLERFIETMLPKDLSRKGFIASQLQIESYDQESISTIQKMRSLKRLKNLLYQTIQDIKAIEVSHIARHRG